LAEEEATVQEEKPAEGSGSTCQMCNHASHEGAKCNDCECGSK